MYAYIEGRLASLDPAFAVLDTGGVGYLIRIPATTYDQVKANTGEKTKLYTHHHVTEDSQTLYGFYSEEDRNIFQTFITASGVGPAIGLAALSQMKGRDIAQAIVTGNAAVLQRIKGLGAKTAQKLMLDLKTKMLKTITLEPGQTAGFGNNNRDEALTALVTLGIPRAMAEKSLDTILKEEPDLTTEELIRRSLRR
jgi:Holliday junction DNA helicase RuvA